MSAAVVPALPDRQTRSRPIKREKQAFRIVQQWLEAISYVEGSRSFIQCVGIKTGTANFSNRAARSFDGIYKQQLVDPVPLRNTGYCKSS